MDLLKQFKPELTRSSQVCQLIIGSEKIAFTIIKQIKGMLVGSASNKTDCCFELDRVGFWPSFALTKYFSSWRIKIMLALIVTWITRNCSGWLEFKAGFWFLIDFVRHKGVYWLGSFELRLKWNEPLFCLSLTNGYTTPPPLHQVEGEHKTSLYV